jgi:HD-like signal output (HDOD) protein
MVTDKEIVAYIEKIPPLPQSVQACIAALKQDDLTNAAKAASQDEALGKYLISIVNRASFGFTTHVTDFSQIFGILGLDSAKQILTSYLISILAPSKWEVFGINNKVFNEFQARMIDGWNRISEQKGYHESYKSAAVLLGAAIIVSEELFKSNKKDLDLIVQTSSISYNTILKRLAHKSFVDIAIMIGQEWDADSAVLELLKEALEDHSIGDHDEAKFLHLLTFFELSQGKMMETGLNNFIDFDREYVSTIYPEFMTIMEIA